MPPELVPFTVSDLGRVLVYGTGATGAAVAAALRRRNVEVVTADDRADAAADVPAPGPDALDALVAGVDAVAPAPGVPRRHPLFGAAARHRRPIVSELDLAEAWSDVPVVAVTGTNGKTTVCSLVTEILRSGGVDAELAGNNDEPLVAAVDRRGVDRPDAFVVEASSFRLDPVQHFRPAVAVWLNLAPDHLDWHPHLDDYVAAKARITARQRSGDTLVVPVDDPVVRDAVAGTAATIVTFGPGGDWDVSADRLRGPAGTVPFAAPLERDRPHERTDAAAAAAASSALGVGPDTVAGAVAAFRGVAHRLMPVGRIDGVVYYDDSKATSPHATLAALSGFVSAVLIAGGRNKGLDLGELRAGARAVRHVVAIGEAAGDVAAAFDGLVPVTTAGSMADAVAAARSAASPGDAVLLSPACASFDWYSDYGARGDDFARAVAALVPAGAGAGGPGSGSA